FLPTLLAAAGAAAPDGVEGTSFLPVLEGSADALERDAVFWHYPHYGNQGGTPGSSVRSGRYKLIEFFETGRLELFDLETDIGESRDLADKFPEVRDRLHRQLVAWRESVDAKIPRPNPDYQAWTDRAPESRHLVAGIEFD
ncbi:MAG TPA: sulfatase/phosphatase domain-containing protein, partial [Spirochaetia bacterium]|nr:sulfatase/phosphatase domain-containing protein [Spirochaetia bacterium]